MSGKIGAAIVIFAYVLVLLVLTRPGSQGPALVGNFGTALKSVIQAGTGGGSYATGQ